MLILQSANALFTIVIAGSS